MIPAQHAQEPADIATSSDDYARRFAGKVGTWLIDVQNDLFASLIKEFPAKTALDVGGGHAQLVAPLNNAGIIPEILGSDERSKQQLGKLLAQGKCTFKIGSLINIPVSDKSVDVVSSIRFISHCEEWRTLIAELCRTAKLAVIIDYPPLISGNILVPITFRLKKMIEGNTRPFSIFTHQEICQEFARHGFVLKKRAGLFFFPMGLHRLLKSPPLSSLLENFAQVLGLRWRFGSPTLALFIPKA